MQKRMLIDAPRIIRRTFANFKLLRTRSIVNKSLTSLQSAGVTVMRFLCDPLFAGTNLEVIFPSLLISEGERRTKKPQTRREWKVFSDNSCEGLYCYALRVLGFPCINTWGKFQSMDGRTKGFDTPR